MKKILTAFVCLIATGAYGYEVCGPDVIDAAGYAYTYTYSSTDLALGYWALGDNCTDSRDEYNINNMCANIVAAGEAFCSGQYYGSKNFDETTASYGNNCWCRRTKMRVGGETVDSIGQWVLIGVTKTCQNVCAQICAENVLNNANYMRNAIMVLPSF